MVKIGMPKERNLVSKYMIKIQEKIHDGYTIGEKLACDMS